MRYLKIAVLIVLSSGFAIALWEGVKKTDLIKLKEIKFEGASTQNELRLRKKIGIQPGEAFWSKSIDAQAKNLKTDPWVEDVQIKRIFPATMLVQITERKPVAVLGNGKGQFKYLDGDNNIIDYADSQNISQAVAKYPVLFGEKLLGDVSLREKALNLVKALPEEGSLSHKDVSDIEFDEEHGFQIRLAKTGILIGLGQDNLPLHLDRARRVVQYLDQHNINASRVDSDYSKKVLVKVRKGR
jgi:cell division protein FtsQ